VHRGQPGDQVKSQRELGLGGAAGQHQRGADLIGGEFVGHGHAGVVF